MQDNQRKIEKKEQGRQYGDPVRGPSDRIRTCGILLPKQARYQLRYTRLFSFLCMIPCGEEKSKFFVSVGSAVVKPGFAGGSSGGGFPPQATVPRTSRLSLFGEWIGSLSSQITRAANYATFGHRYFSRPGAFFPTYVRQYTLRSAALALWHHLLLDRGQHDGFILYLSILPVSPPKSSLFASGRYVGKAVRRLWGLRTA